MHAVTIGELAAAYATIVYGSDSLTARQLARVDVDDALAYLSAVRAAGEAIAGPKGLSRRARKLEQKLTRKLKSGWKGSADDAISSAVSTLLTGSGDVTAAELDDILDNVAHRLGPAFASDVMPKVRDHLTSSYTLGRAVFGRDGKGRPAGVKFNVADQRAVSWLERDTQYWIGTKYDRHMASTIATTVRETVIEGGLGRKAAGRALEKALADQMLDPKVVGRKGYWSGLAAVASTRARSFGTVEGLVDAGIDRYEYVAIMDEATSDICRELNGRVFETSAAVALRDRIIAADDPEDVKSIAPWVNVNDVRDKASEALAAAGVMMPPAHFRCRSTVVSVSLASNDVSVRTPDGATRATKKAFGVLTADEVSNKLEVVRARGAAGQLVFTGSAAGLDRHGTSLTQFREPFASSSKFHEEAAAVVSRADRVFGHADADGNRVYSFIDTKSRMITTGTDGGAILSFNGLDAMPEDQFGVWLKTNASVRVEVAGLRAGDAVDVFGVHPEIKGGK